MAGLRVEVTALIEQIASISHDDKHQSDQTLEARSKLKALREELQVAEGLVKSAESKMLVQGRLGQGEGVRNGKGKDKEGSASDRQMQLQRERTLQEASERNRQNDLSRETVRRETEVAHEVCMLAVITALLCYSYLVMFMLFVFYF